MMTDMERLIALEAIRELKARRDQAVDRKDWATYAALHSDDFVGAAIPNQQGSGGKAAAAALEVQMANVTTVHHSHSPVIEFQDSRHATGIWAMEDNLFWYRDGEKQWLRGFGFYYETYAKEADGQEQRVGPAFGEIVAYLPVQVDQTRFELSGIQRRG